MKKIAIVVISRNVSLDLNTVSYNFAQKIRKRLTLDNPVYVKNKKMGYWTGNIPRYINLWYQHDKWLVLPRGFMTSLFKEMKISGVNYKIFDYRLKKEPVEFYSNITLRDYQKPSVERALKFSHGIIEAPCGSGKTIIGLQIIALARQPALWLVHTMELAEQAMEQIEKFLGIKKDDTGFIGGGKWNIGEKITVGMIQTLSKNKLTSDFVKKFGIIILDEAHHAPANSFTSVINQFPAYYRFGFTATPYRGDGLGMIMYYQIGYTVYKITNYDLSLDGNLVKPVIKKIETDFYYNYQDDFTRMINFLVKDKKRNKLIMELLLKELKESRHCLVLSDRVDHCKFLYGYLKESYPDINCAVLTGDISKKKRMEIVELVNAGKLNAVFATSKLAEEGLDWKILDRLFLTCPSRSKRKIQQAIGRIQRPFEGKENAVVYDFVDVRIGVLESQYKSRYFGVYEPLEHLENFIDN